MQCVLCGNTQSKTVSNIDSKTTHYLSVVQCNVCGFVQQDPVPTTEELTIYYSHNYRKDYKNTVSPKPKHIYRAGKNALERLHILLNAQLSTGTLLDIGAGGGEFVYLAGKLGFQSQGVEPSIGYSEYASREYGCVITTGHLDKVSGTYDIITLFHVLEHLPSPTDAFEKLYSLLNSKGKIFIEVPWIETNDASPHNIYFKAHIFYFSTETLISSASQFFDVITIDTSSNLRILFEAKAEPASLKLPSTESVDKLKHRLNSKGWLEYLFKGKGLLKPISKIIRIFDETKVKNISPVSILDHLALKVLANKSTKHRPPALNGFTTSVVSIFFIMFLVTVFLALWPCDLQRYQLDQSMDEC